MKEKGSEKDESLAGAIEYASKGLVDENKVLKEPLLKKF